MRALLFNQGEQNLVAGEIPEPQPAPDEVLLEMQACGICGTDVHIARGQNIPTAFSPIVLGHEPAGIVAKVGAEVSGWKAGERVVSFPGAFCGECPACQKGREGLCMLMEIFGLHRHGAMTFRMTTPARALVRLPDSIPFEIGAILTDAVSTPYHAVVRRAQLMAGETVAVFGVGGLGSQAVRFCKLVGASRIIAVDRNDSALKLSEKIGATDLVKADDDTPPHKQIRQLTGGYGVDACFEFVGLTATVESAVKSLRRGGRAVVVGIGMEKLELPPIRTFVGNEYELRGSMGLDLRDLREVIGLVEEGKLDLTDAVHPISFDEVNGVLTKLERGKADNSRYVLSHKLS